MDVADGLTALFAAGLFGAMGLAVAGWLWGPAALARWRRARVRRQPFPQAWREILRQRMPAFARMPSDVQLQLKKHAQVLIAEKPFIGCAGVSISDEMRVLVAVQAALLLLNRHAGFFTNLRQVLIYPGAFVVARQTADGSGLTHDTRRTLAGESWQQGQVLLSWHDVLQGAADPQDGRNVVLHEFAHQLDQEAGAANGAPWQAGHSRRMRWARVMNAEFQRLRESLARGEAGLFDDYAASEPAEFFAVATEVFFERPSDMARLHAGLYHELRQFYHADPLHWLESSPMVNASSVGIGTHPESSPFGSKRPSSPGWPLHT